MAENVGKHVLSLKILSEGGIYVICRLFVDIVSLAGCGPADEITPLSCFWSENEAQTIQSLGGSAEFVHHLESAACFGGGEA